MFINMISASIAIIIQFSISVTTAFVTIFLLNYFYLRCRLRKIPSIIGLPFFGIVWDLIKVPIEDQQEWFTKSTAKFKGEVFLTWMGTRPYLNIQKPKHMEILLSSSTNIKKSSIYELIDPWLGNGLLTSTGKMWFHMRRLLTPAFHFKILEQFTNVMLEKVKILNDCLENYLSDNPERPFDIYYFISKYTLDVICETAMGVNINAQRNTKNSYIEALREFSNLTLHRYARPWYAWNFIYTRTENGQKFKEAVKIMHEFNLKVIREKINKKKKEIALTNDDENEEDKFDKRKKKAFLDLLLEASEKDEHHPLSIHEIREQVDTVIFAGHDTTATAISWTLFALGNDPKIQEKVHDELREVFDNDADKPATIAELTRLKYLDRVIKEVLRLYPSAPFIFRDLSEDVTFDDYVIPKGISVTINIFDLHRDPVIWKNPTGFNPDRFLPENMKGMNPYSYIPFSAGPRNCIGQKFALLELKIALVSILRKWRIESLKSPKEIKFQSDLILRCHGSIELNLTRLESR